MILFKDGIEQLEQRYRATFINSLAGFRQAVMVGVDGFVNLSSSEVLISQGLDAYFVSREIGRLPYAKP